MIRRTIWETNNCKRIVQTWHRDRSAELYIFIPVLLMSIKFQRQSSILGIQLQVRSIDLSIYLSIYLSGLTPSSHSVALALQSKLSVPTLIRCPFLSPPPPPPDVLTAAVYGLGLRRVTGTQYDIGAGTLWDCCTWGRSCTTDYIATQPTDGATFRSCQCQPS